MRSTPILLPASPNRKPSRPDDRSPSHRHHHDHRHDGDFQDTKGRVVDDLKEIKRELNTLAGQQTRLQQASAAYARQQAASAQQLQQTTQTTRRHPSSRTREAVDVSDASSATARRPRAGPACSDHLQGRLRETAVLRRQIDTSRALQVQDTGQDETIRAERQELEKLLVARREEAELERNKLRQAALVARTQGRTDAAAFFNTARPRPVIGNASSKPSVNTSPR